MNKKQLMIAAMAAVLSVSAANAESVITGITGVGGVGTSGTFDINPAQINGDVGYRQYDQFTLGKGDIANLIYQYGGKDLETFINLVDSGVNINGILNTMRDGNFYNGHAVFITPGGMTIGYAATGYDTAFDILRNQKCSFVAFDEMVAERIAAGDFSFDVLMDMVKENFGLVAPGESAEVEALVMNDYEYARLQKAYDDAMSGNVDGYEESLLYGGYNPISVTLTHIINNKAGIGWTSYAHTGLPVPVYAYGEGAEAFIGSYDNTQVALRLMDLTDAR